MEDLALLEQQVTLAEILDPDSLQRVCMTFARLFGTGIAVVDSKGQVLVDIPAQYQLCRRIGAHPAGPRICGKFDMMIQSAEADSASGSIPESCPCGLSYEMLAIRHQGMVLGRMVFGPFRPEDLDEPAPGLAEALKSDDPERDERVLREATADMQKMATMSRERSVQAITSIGEVLSVIVQTSYARHLTSQIHIAAIQEAYNELTEKNRRLADSVEKLKDLDKLKSNFLATVSHELRTPLTSVIGYSEMLIEGLAGDLSSEQRDYVQIIMEKGDQLLQIITEVLDISKIEAGNIQLSCEWVQLPTLLQQIADSMMPHARSKEIALNYEIPPDLPAVWADRAKTRQAILNLVANAIKFTPRDGAVTIVGERSQIQVESGSPVAAARPAVTVRVIDNGIGVPEDSRERIFEAFYQVDSSSTREYGGTGLGLSIVKNFIEAHGGHVWVEPGESAGSVFIVQLPVRPAQVTSSKAAQRSRSAG
jgi:signal transduction histidine kinase